MLYRYTFLFLPPDYLVAVTKGDYEARSVERVRRRQRQCGPDAAKLKGCVEYVHRLLIHILGQFILNDPSACLHDIDTLYIYQHIINVVVHCKSLVHNLIDRHKHTN